MAEIVPGTLIGRYEVVRHLGTGAMGDVFLAADDKLKRKVAIKLLRTEHGARSDLKKRFKREARAVANINHANVVQVFDIDEHDGRPYYVMEYLTGKDTDLMLEELGPLPAGLVAAIGLGAARGLQAAWEVGVVHRDIKPANLLVTDDDEVKVMDFGLAKATRTVDTSANLTISGTTLGTPDYMSPEQARGESVDQFADIYSLGCTLFQLTAGRLPFREYDEKIAYMEVISRHVQADIPRIDQFERDTPRELCDLVERMMAKKAKHRPDYDEIISKLKALSRGQRPSTTYHPVIRRDANRRGGGSDSGGGGGSSNRSGDTGSLAAAPQRTVLARVFFLVGVAVLSAGAAFATYHFALRGDDGKKRSGRGSAANKRAVASGRGGSAAGSGATNSSSGSAAAASAVTVDMEPVRVNVVLTVAPEQKQRLTKLGPQAPARGLTFTEAKQISARLGARLPTYQEYRERVIGHEAIKRHEKLCEWVDKQAAGRKPRVFCVKGDKLSPRRPDKRYPDTIFRLVNTKR
ncbi:MAG: serine/threonine protein kinase [Myxococcales bacterium]|nr:serine/threonine protein kinase [Myxococcales bacterium]